MRLTFPYLLIQFGSLCSVPVGGGGDGTPLYGLYGDVPLDRVLFFGLSALNRVYNFMRTCPRQGLNLS